MSRTLRFVGRSPDSGKAVPHIHIHINRQLEDDKGQVNPETVVFLGDFSSIETHYHLSGAYEGKTTPCEGEGCQYCIESPKSKRVTHYAPSLVNLPGDLDDNKQRIWTRAIYCLPQDAGDRLIQPNLRGRIYKIWRRRRGRASCIKSESLGRCFKVEEPDYDIGLLLTHFWWPSAETRADVAKFYRKLSPTIQSPILTTPPVAKYVDDRTPEEAEQARKTLQEGMAARRMGKDPKEPKNVLDNGTGEILCEEYGEKMDKIKSKRKGGVA